MPKPYFESLIGQLSERSSQATLSMLGITDPGLRKHLSHELEFLPGRTGFLADPVFEATFPWTEADITMSALKGSLLQPSLVDALDQPPKELAGEYAFKSSWSPYVHQLKAWKALIEEPNRSVVVTSGTGSGKTECFMVPVLNDLAREYEATGSSLVGVRALFLYPLNALINSQRDRLTAWTHAYGDAMRFCLYNGNTKEQVKAHIQAQTKNEVLSRKLMRDSPAPILVTNATMLEYMLVRHVDAPIIEKSQGALRWIVLDEAHTYIGSQAAELSLLLRRVMHNFGVSPSDVRFVATSATIGDSDGANELRRYLADLAGISESQVTVIGGSRHVPSLDGQIKQANSFHELRLIDADEASSTERFNALSAHTVSSRLRDELGKSGRPKTLTQLQSIVGELSNQGSSSIEHTLRWLDLCSATLEKRSKQPFLPLRAHLYHQTVNGLWCCADSSCNAKSPDLLDSSWPFGNVTVERKSECACGAPVYELVFCSDCNTPYLVGMEKGHRLVQFEQDNVDEFSLQVESEEVEDSEPALSFSEVTYLSGTCYQDKTITLPLHRITRELNTPESEDSIQIEQIIPPGEGEGWECLHCGNEGFRKTTPFRHSRLGAPFYISNTVPSLLEYCQDHKEANERPGRGRRLITFTDSRQGTARIAAKVQQDAERERLRGLVYGALADTSSGKKTELSPETEKLKERIQKAKDRAQKFEGLDDDLVSECLDMARELEEELKEILESGQGKPIPWREMVLSLEASKDLSRWMFNYYKSVNPILFSGDGARKSLAEILLIREFARRPKRQNSMETLGLASVRYPSLDSLSASNEWYQLGFDDDDWRTFLKVVADFYLRANSVLDIPSDWMRWLGITIRPRTVLHPHSLENTSKNAIRWPQARGVSREHRLVRILNQVTGRTAEEPIYQDLVNKALLSAWDALIRAGVLKQALGSLEFQLSRESIAFAPCQEAWVCPITHRLIDNCFKGVTPYLPVKLAGVEVSCKKVSIPHYVSDLTHVTSDADRLARARDWVQNQKPITELRSVNLWSDLSDRVVEGGSFFYAAEHSAQQPQPVLQDYAARFKDGYLNVLSCSTTMEMGVDIGGISMVAMNNVPPHPANYLQRAGRAGRRGETRSVAFTLCKDNPHERGVFADPLWPFTTSIPAPYITLGSARIVQRHVNSLVFGYFLKTRLLSSDTEATRLTCEWFFCGSEGEVSPKEKFCGWIEHVAQGEKIPESLASGIKRLVTGSVLSGYSPSRLLVRVGEHVNAVSKAWLPSYSKLAQEFESIQSLSESDPYRRRVEKDLKRLGQEYLLSELAARAFLPGYGFPTGIATFDPFSITDYISNRASKELHGRDDNLLRMQGKPSRDLPVAIREYAPGADVVLDGVVYRSAGIVLNRFDSNANWSSPQKLDTEYRCDHCGHIGNLLGKSDAELGCEHCGTTIKESNKREYIEPVGFAVDFYESPHNDVTTQKYIPVQDPWLSAGSSTIALANPALGVFRSNSEGHIFYHSSGEFGHGFAVCLRCGRADSMPSATEYPKDLAPNKTHKRLRGKPDNQESNVCEGSEEQYAIKGGLHLGHVDRTDIFELYLKNPHEGRYLWGKDKRTNSLLYTLAVVLRQALADTLGVNADEMGYSVKETSLPDQDAVSAIVLYDKCGGGAGFATSAGKHIGKMFSVAKRYLNCPENCGTSCQSCLLGYDTRFILDKLDRHVALEYLDLIEPFLGLPDEQMVLGAGTQYCHESLEAELLHAMQSVDTTLKIPFTGAPENWEISCTRVRELLPAWLSRCNGVEIFLTQSAFNGLNEDQKNDLHVLQLLGAKLAFGSQPLCSDSGAGTLLAQLCRNDGTSVAFGSPKLEASVPNTDWWKIEGELLVKSDDVPPLVVDEFLTKDHFEKLAAGDVEIDLTDDLDGSLSGFGRRLWDRICSEHSGIGSQLKADDPLESIEYSDCFVSSPWNVAVLGSVFVGLRNASGEVWASPDIKISTGSFTGKHIKGTGFFNDWADDAEREKVIEAYFGRLGFKCFAYVKDKKGLPHGRFLLLKWKSGVVMRVRFDQGVGYWAAKTLGFIKFSQNDQIVQQAHDLEASWERLQVKHGKSQPTQIFVKGLSA
ncbi:DEAD/DEAH box helicase [Motiliproteus sp. SC1-56]|uniref:DEAD/DEAH box helicase n=1 Tax=Motiliproteus sp. SC1-56 TaxID=2799565 RepID=UPI001A8CD280|nr:DEAD/DEAH box helicase [Motiliproteus sp. SC1-56]